MVRELNSNPPDRFLQELFRQEKNFQLKEVGLIKIYPNKSIISKIMRMLNYELRQADTKGIK